MNKRLIILFGGIFLFLVLWLLLKPKKPDMHSPLAKKEPTLVTEPASSIQAPAAQAPVAMAPSKTNDAVALINSPAGQARLQAFQQRWDETNRKSLDFYGKIIDQYGTPVAGVKVKAAVGLVLGFEHSGGQDYYAESDTEGRFSFREIHGAGAGFTLTKDGYFYNQRLPSSSRPDDYVPDSHNPVIFAMWKIKGAEPIIHTKFGAWIPYDGTPVRIDLFTGKKSDAGDLQVSLVRNPLQVRRGADHFEWEVQIQVPGAGLTESKDSYPYEAPEGGYQPLFAFGQAKDAPNWTRKLLQTFYVHTAKGDYGRIDVDLTTDSDRPEGTGLSVETWINPSGSRNLEIDPSKEIKVK